MQAFEVWIKKGRLNSDYRLSTELCVMMNVLTDAKDKSMKLCPPTKDEEAVSTSLFIAVQHHLQFISLLPSPICFICNISIFLDRNNTLIVTTIT